MGRELLIKLKGKKQRHRQWKQGQVTWEEHRVIVQSSRDDLRKTKAKLELNLKRNARNNRKGFYR